MIKLSRIYTIKNGFYFLFLGRGNTLKFTSKKAVEKHISDLQKQINVYYQSIIKTLIDVKSNYYQILLNLSSKSKISILNLIDSINHHLFNSLVNHKFLTTENRNPIILNSLNFIYDSINLIIDQLIEFHSKNSTTFKIYELRSIKLSFSKFNYQTQLLTSLKIAV